MANISEKFSALETELSDSANLTRFGIGNPIRSFNVIVPAFLVQRMALQECARDAHEAHLRIDISLSAYLLEG